MLAVGANASSGQVLNTYTLTHFWTISRRLFIFPYLANGIVNASYDKKVFRMTYRFNSSTILCIMEIEDEDTKI